MADGSAAARVLGGGDRAHPRTVRTSVAVGDRVAAFGSSGNAQGREHGDQWVDKELGHR